MRAAKLGKAGELLGILDCFNDIKYAIAAAASSGEGMSESAYRVETTPRLAQWRIETLSSCTYRKSDPFKIGLWNWFVFYFSFLLFL